MDLDKIAETLAKKHEMSKDDFFSMHLAEAYTDNGKSDSISYLEELYDIHDNKVLIPRYEEESIMCGINENYNRFINEFNEILDELNEDYQLSYILVRSHEGTIKACDFMTFNLINKAGTKISFLINNENTGLDLYHNLDELGAVITSNLEPLISDIQKGNNPTIGDMFHALQIAYDKIQDQNVLINTLDQSF